MNVLFVQGEHATLLRGEQAAQGPLSGLRALARRLNARGQTVLVLSGTLQPIEMPPGLPDDQRLTYLDSRASARVSLHPQVAGPGSILCAHDLAAITRATAAAKTAGLRVAGIVPLVGCALRAAGSPPSAVVVHVHEDAYDSNIISIAHVKSHSQVPSARLDLTKVITTALSRPQASGDAPQVIIVGAPQDIGPLPGSVTPQFLSLEAALAGAADRKSVV